jgi:hypothetical protein
MECTHRDEPPARDRAHRRARALRRAERVAPSNTTGARLRDPAARRGNDERADCALLDRLGARGRCLLRAAAGSPRAVVRAPARGLPAGAGRRRGEPRARGPRRIRDPDGGDALALATRRCGARQRARLSPHLLPLAAGRRARPVRRLRASRAPRGAAARGRRARAMGAGAGPASPRDHDVRRRRRLADLGGHAGGRPSCAADRAPAAAARARGVALSGEPGRRDAPRGGAGDAAAPGRRLRPDADPAGERRGALPADGSSTAAARCLRSPSHPGGWPASRSC